MSFSISIKMEDLRSIFRFLKYSLTRAESISTQDKLYEIMADIKSGLEPRIVAEKIGLVLQQGIIAHKDMPRKHFDTFSYDVIKSLTANFQNIHFIWKGGLIKYLYLPDLKEIWIAYEPPLDLVTTDDGAYYILKNQLRIVEKLIYFQNLSDYVTKLKKMLERDNVDASDIDKIQYVPLPQPYAPPIVLYISHQEVVGVQGKFSPPIQQNDDGKYSLRQKLPRDWMIELNNEDALTHKKTLSIYLDQKEL